MWSITWQMMRKNLRMLIPAGIAVLIGTAFIAATLLFSNAMSTAMREQVTAQYGSANYVLSVDSKSAHADSAYSTTAGELGLDKISNVAGVEGIRPVIEGRGVLTSGDHNVSDIVLATSADVSLLPVDIVSGKAPTPNGTQEIAIPSRIAKDWGVQVGDHIHINSNAHASAVGSEDSAIDVRITGLTDDPAGVYNYYGGASVVSNDVITQLAGAQSMSDINVTQVYMKINAAEVPAAQNSIMHMVPQGFAMNSRAQVAERAMQTMSGQTDVTRNFLLAFGALALVVAALVIANTFQVLVAQRRRTLALLRTIGATQRQLYGSVLQEALMLGLVSSLLGVGVGIGLMALVTTSGVSAGMMGAMHVVVTWPVFVVPILFGTIMTILASLGAARMATGVSPLEAMRPLELTSQRKSKMGRAIIGMLCLLVGTALVVLALVKQQGHEDLALLAAIAGCALAFLGAALTALFWMPWLMRGAGAFVSLFGPSAKLAAANIRKNPRRVAATGTALLIGVTLISTLATGAMGAKATMNHTLDTRYSVDLIVSGPQVPASAAKEAAKVKGVAHSLYAPSAIGRFTDANGKQIDTTIVGVPDVAALQSVLNVDLGNVTLGTDDVIMQRYEAFNGTPMAFNNRVELMETQADENGNTTELGKADLTVVQRDMRRVSPDNQSVAFVNEQLFNNGTFSTQSHIMMMKTDQSSQTLSQTVDGVTKAFEAYPGVNIGGPVMERQTWGSMVDMMLKLLVALLAVAVIIAVIGVANTLSLSVIERTKESATLRAIGMTRGQLRASLCIEALLIAVVASIVGMVLGTLFGWAGLTMVMSQIGQVVYSVDWVTYGIILLLAVVCALIASIIPARRATRTAPVEALAEA